MIVGSTFSGVGGLDLGLERAGMSIKWQAESDEWCRRVLARHWPDTYIYEDVSRIYSGQEREGGQPRIRGGDFTDANGSDLGQQPSPNGIDLLCGGFPCQDLSIAGKKEGLSGERSKLFFEYARIADELKPKWLLLENVTGLLSASKGRDYAILLATLAEIGYSVSWRVADARYFGVPQRRRRVFIVGYFGDDGSRAALSLGAGGEGDIKAGACSWQKAAARARSGTEEAGQLASTLQTTCHDWSRSDNFNIVNQESELRRLTPVECERLMSWPDNWTAIDGDKTPLSRRYKACGNGVVSNVAEWIGRRIMAISNLP